MKRHVVLISLAVAAVAVAATPWVIGWQAERLVRARVAQIDADKSASIRLRIDAYDRAWRGATARISVVERDGTALLTLPATIRHWPFAKGGPADWTAVPELGQPALDALGPWGAKLPELTTRTRISWGGDVSTIIESPAFKRRVPEEAAGTLEIAAIAGTVNWLRDGALNYDVSLPLLRVERLPHGRTGAPNVAELKDAVLKGDGALGTVERRWNQKGSASAASISVTEGGTQVLSATPFMLTYATRDEGANVGVAFTVAVSALTARHAMQDLTDATVEVSFDARQLAKAPLGQLFDAAAAQGRDEDTSTRKRPGAAPAPAPSSSEPLADLLRGSPSADLRTLVKAREGRYEIKLALAFDGNGMEADSGLGTMLARLDLRLDAVASMALVIHAARAGSEKVAGLVPPPPGRTGPGLTLPDMPPLRVDPDALARQQIRDAAAQGWIRIEGDDVASTVTWKGGRLTVNGKDMDALRDLALGLAGR